MLWLLPNLLSDDKESISLFPSCLPEIVANLDGLIAESDKGALYFFKRFTTKKRFNEMPYTLLNEHTKDSDLDFILEPLVKGEEWGLISDAGLPAIADPGANLILHARKHNIAVKAIPGPSSLFLAIMLSGLPSQKFTFHGYPPRHDLEQWLQKIEKEKGLHIFIEAPYRNQATFEKIISTLKPPTMLSVSQDLTGSEEWTKTFPIKSWKSSNTSLQKAPAIYLIYN